MKSGWQISLRQKNIWLDVGGYSDFLIFAFLFQASRVILPPRVLNCLFNRMFICQNSQKQKSSLKNTLAEKTCALDAFAFMHLQSELTWKCWSKAAAWFKIQAKVSHDYLLEAGRQRTALYRGKKAEQRCSTISALVVCLSLLIVFSYNCTEMRISCFCEASSVSENRTAGD